jgi:hypothetical protein
MNHHQDEFYKADTNPSNEGFIRPPEFTQGVGKVAIVGHYTTQPIQEPHLGTDSLPDMGNAKVHPWRAHLG